MFTLAVRKEIPGQERDGETGLDFMHARYYGAALGRFTSPDPRNAGADLYNPQSWNGYAYVNNNPLVYTDPSGLFGWSDIGNFFGGVGGAIYDWFNPPCEAMFCTTATSVSDISTGSIGVGGGLATGAASSLASSGGGSANFTATGLGKADISNANTPAQQPLQPPKSGIPAPRTLSCQINSRAANISGGQFLHSIGVNHEWITTSTGISVGMGTARGVPQSDYPGTLTQIVSHTGQVPTSSVIFNNIDAAALNTYIKVGTPTGPWIPGVNDCNTWANGAINNSTPHNITIGIYGVPIRIGTNVVVYSDGSIHAPGGN